MKNVHTFPRRPLKGLGGFPLSAGTKLLRQEKHVQAKQFQNRLLRKGADICCFPIKSIK